MPPRLARSRFRKSDEEVQDSLREILEILSTNKYIARLLEDVRNKTRFAVRPKDFE
jgi:DNA-binding phage protein